MQELRFRAMGCEMLALLDSDDARVGRLLESVPGWFEGWEQALSRFRPASELSLLNAAGGPTRVGGVLWDVLEVALDVAERSGGLVRPTVLPSLEAAGYDRSFADMPADGPAAAPAPPPADWRAIRRDRLTRTVALPEGLRIDLGGVAKGWAAEQAARRLSAGGPALIDAGGDIAVSGPMASGDPWPIEVASPLEAERGVGLLLVPRGVVATSGRDYRRWRSGGVEQHHIIDPRTGRPAETDVLTATVVAQDGPTAEMAAKMIFLRGSAGGLSWAEAHPSLAALVVREDGRVLRSSRMASYLYEAA